MWLALFLFRPYFLIFKLENSKEEAFGFLTLKPYRRVKTHPNVTINSSYRKNEYRIVFILIKNDKSARLVNELSYLDEKFFPNQNFIIKTRFPTKERRNDIIYHIAIIEKKTNFNKS